MSRVQLCNGEIGANLIVIQKTTSNKEGASRNEGIETAINDRK